jgi:hypothetical protein
MFYDSAGRAAPNHIQCKNGRLSALAGVRAEPKVVNTTAARKFKMQKAVSAERWIDGVSSQPFVAKAVWIDSLSLALVAFVCVTAAALGKLYLACLSARPQPVWHGLVTMPSPQGFTSSCLGAKHVPIPATGPRERGLKKQPSSPASRVSREAERWEVRKRVKI